MRRCRLRRRSLLCIRADARHGLLQARQAGRSRCHTHAEDAPGAARLAGGFETGGDRGLRVIDKLGIDAVLVDMRARGEKV